LLKSSRFGKRSGVEFEYMLPVVDLQMRLG